MPAPAAVASDHAVTSAPAAEEETLPAAHSASRTAQRLDWELRQVSERGFPGTPPVRMHTVYICDYLTGRVSGNAIR